MGIESDRVLPGKSSLISPSASSKKEFSARELKVHQTPLHGGLNLPLDVRLNFQRLGDRVAGAPHGAQGGAVVCHKLGGVVGVQLAIRRPAFCH